MTITAQRGKPSTLADLVAQVKEAFDRMGDATPILIGKAHRGRGVGSSPRVVFMPEAGAGKLRAATRMGDAAAMVHTCDVLVRASESGEDVERFKAVYALMDRVVSCIIVAGTGRIEWGSVSDGSPTDTDAYGAEIVFSFSFTRDILHDAARWALPPADANTDGETAHPPPGTVATSATIDASTEPIN